MTAPSPSPTGTAPHVVEDLAAAAVQSAQQVSFKSLMLGNGPRFARDAFGPLLAFYGGWKLFGLTAGIAMSTIVSVAAWQYERRKDRQGNLALLTLLIVFIQAAAGLASGSEKVYLAQPVIINGLFGVAFLGSVVLRKPLAGLFATEFYPFPAEVKASRTFGLVMGRISLAWGLYNIARSGLRIAMLGRSVEAFLAINFITGVPVTTALMAWSIWYGVRGFRRSTEWGWAMRGEAPPPEVVAAWERPTV